MLILDRQKEGKIYIYFPGNDHLMDPDLTITVVRGLNTSLGFQCSRDVTILTHERLTRKLQESKGPALKEAFTKAMNSNEE